MSTRPARILIVEDDARLGSLLADYLSDEGYLTALEPRGDCAVERILAETPDLVVLDLMLPGEDGLSICRRVRASYEGAILMLTARRSDVDQIVGLELGADDYVVKPIEPRVLLARVRSLLRRARPPAPETSLPDKVELGTLVVGRARREVWVGQSPVELTEAELEILWRLVAHAGDIVTRDELFQEVLGVRYDGLDRGVDIHISRIRKKLDAAGLPRFMLRSVRGSGYLMVQS